MRKSKIPLTTGDVSLTTVCPSHEKSRGQSLTKQVFDPQLLPIDALAGEAPVPAERLTVKWLRTRFADPATGLPEGTMEQLCRQADTRPLDSPIAASVLIGLVEREDGLKLLLTQRTSHLTDHGGQISLPGGRAEIDDGSAIETALREAEEEIGLNASQVEILGLLPDYFTVTAYRITPVVALVHPPLDLLADPFEVEEIFEVPLEFLMNGGHHQRRSVPLPDGSGRRTFYSMPYEHRFIWGATAGILRNLFHFLRA
jgi:8-oxo-dGTP pyrophosphatase MutT (NUDIX family)